MCNSKKIISICMLFFILTLVMGCNNSKKPEAYKVTIDTINIVIPENFRKAEENENIISFNDNLNKVNIEKIKDIENFKIDEELKKVKDEYKKENTDLVDVIFQKDVPKIHGLAGLNGTKTIHIYFIENGNTIIKITCNGDNDSSALVFRNIAKSAKVEPQK